MKRIVTIVIALLLALCSLWYHRHVVSGYEAEIASIKGVYAQTQAKIANDAVRIFNEALAKREAQYADSNKAGKTASVSIATAQSDHKSVDVDGLLPSAINDALLLQYERVCSSGSCGVASGAAISVEAVTGAAEGAVRRALDSTPGVTVDK